MKTDKEIERIIDSVTGSSYFGGDLFLIATLETSWKRMAKDIDLENDTNKLVDTDGNILINVKDLVTDKSSIWIMVNQWVVEEKNLMISDDGYPSIPDDFEVLEHIDIDLSGDIDQEIIDILCDVANDNQDELIGQLIRNQELPDLFISDIQDMSLRIAFSKSWEKQKIEEDLI